MSDDDDMHCLQFTKLITEYEEGALNDDLRRAFETHRGYCDGCQTLLAQLDTTKALAKELAEPGDVPAKLVEAYQRTIQDQKEKPDRQT